MGSEMCIRDSRRRLRAERARRRGRGHGRRPCSVRRTAGRSRAEHASASAWACRIALVRHLRRVRHGQARDRQHGGRRARAGVALGRCGASDVTPWAEQPGWCGGGGSWDARGRCTMRVRSAVGTVRVAGTDKLRQTEADRTVAFESHSHSQDWWRSAPTDNGRQRGRECHCSLHQLARRSLRRRHRRLLADGARAVSPPSRPCAHIPRARAVRS